MYICHNKINYFWVLLFIKSIILIYIFPIAAPFLLFLSLFFSVRRNINKKTMFISIFLSLIIYVSLYFNKYNKIFFGEYIDIVFNFSIREWIIDFINKNYDERSSSLILITAFSEKNYIGKEIYNYFIELSISHLIVVSGYHLNFFKIIFNRININKYIKFIFLFSILFLINYNLNFNFGIFRASLFLILMHNKKNDTIQMLSLSGIITIFICPLSIKNFSFLMSYLSTFLILILCKKVDNRFLSLISIFSINLLLVPLISQFSNYISITGFIFSFFYSNFFCLLFLFNTLTFWFTFLDFFHILIYEIINFLLNIFNSFNFKVTLIKFDIIFLIIFYIYFLFYIGLKVNKL